MSAVQNGRVLQHNDYSQDRRRALGERVREAEAHYQRGGREDGVVPRVELGFGQHGQRGLLAPRRLAPVREEPALELPVARGLRLVELVQQLGDLAALLRPRHLETFCGYGLRPPHKARGARDADDGELLGDDR